MAMYASNAGKSGGEYYTPQEVSELLAAELIGVDINVSKESFEVILALCADSRCFDSLEYFRECYI